MSSLGAEFAGVPTAEDGAEFVSEDLEQSLQNVSRIHALLDEIALAKNQKLTLLGTVPTHAVPSRLANAKDTESLYD